MSVTAQTACAAASELLFGSVARGDADEISDRDILIVDDDVSILKRRTAELEAAGWSVSSYTFQKMAALANNGALFIQHLKLESKIIHDRTNRMAKILESFTPLSSYRTEIKKNREFADLILEVPDSATGALFAIDVLFVVLRNYGVLFLAEKGVHVYAFQAILLELQKEDLLAPSAVELLTEIRDLKTKYRNKVPVEKGEATSLLLKILPYLPSQCAPKKLEFVSPERILKSVNRAKRQSSYFQLRDLEKKVIALRDLGCWIPPDSLVANIIKWKDNPGIYANLSAALAPVIRREISWCFSELQSRKIVA
ncbi:MAG: nucleotidyltransferase domain-containing protein [Alphaproteobacteria bacterium]|nr:MAG: nucleotidyltransferase domain-containing protein [Alphaproteobacteria bacterium]